MAESILFDIAGEIILQLGSRALREIALWWGVNDEIDRLKGTVSSIQAVLLDAEEKQALDHQVKDWLGKLRDVVFDADDLLDDFSMEALRRKLMNGNRMTREVRIFFSRSNQFVYGLKMGHKIKDLRLKLDDIYKDRETLKLEVRPVERSPASNLRYQTTSSIPEIVVGRDKERDAIIGLLLGSYENENENLSVVSIFGIGGLGKSTLAQLIFNDERVKDHFVSRIWVCVSETFDVKTIVRKILESATGEKAEDLELDTLKKRLDDCLDSKRFLLVLDDVWNEDRENWDSLRRLLVIKPKKEKERLRVRGQTGSMILVTTRSQKVAAITSTLSTYVLEGLSQSESWSLLVEIVFRGKEPRNKRVIEIGNEIVKKCVGVPLAIKTIASLLYFKNPETEWLPFMENELSKVAQSENDILPTLRLSYDHLPSHLKHCFEYCRLFPKDHEFDVKSLICLWIAQGFVKSSELSQCLELIGLGYFMELSLRSFFQELTRDVFGNVISCKMHDLMNDLANLVAGTENKIVHSYIESIDEKTRYVSYGFNLDSSWQVPANLLEAKRLRTFLLPSQVSSLSGNGRWENPSNQALFSNFRRLRVFDLHNLGIDDLSPSIKKLKHLRFLDVSKNSGIKALPNSVTKLQNLQVLKLSGCVGLVELPKEIRKLVNLKHLDCEGCSNLTHMPSGIGKLVSLQTLTWFVVAKDCSASKHIGSLNELSSLDNLRGSLEIRNLGYVKNGAPELKASILKEKQHLESLILSWSGDVKENNASKDEELLERLQPNPNLKGLRVYQYRGLSFPSWLSSLENLVELWIVNCKRCQYLPSLDKIHSLKELWISELDDLEYIETEENNSLSGGERQSMYFPSLKKLWIWKCPNLKGWRRTRNDNELTAAAREPGLALLDVRDCPQLISMPLILSVNGKLDFKNSSLGSLQQIMSMNMMPTRFAGKRLTSHLSAPANLAIIWLKDCRGCQYLPPLDQLHSLTELYFDNLIDVEYVDCVGDNYLAEGGTFFPSLKKFWIWNCPNLKGWQKRAADKATTTAVAELPCFPCLSLLEIRHCPELIQMPLFPYLDERLYYVNSGGQALQQTMKMKMISAQHEDMKFQTSTYPLTNLQEFWISELPDIEYIDDNDAYFLYKQGGSKFFTSLKKLWIDNCPNLKGWWKKRDENDDTTMMTSGKLPYFPCLSLLEIKNCPLLNCMPLFPTLDERLYYVNTGIQPLEKTMKMKMESAQYEDARFQSVASPLSNIKELWISDLSNLEYIDWDEDGYLSESGATVFPFLKKLWIYNCPNLKGWWKRQDGDTKTSTAELPQFPSLSLLEIKHCPKLSWMPLFPFLDQRLYYVKTGLEPLLQTIMVSSFSNLEELWLSELSDLQYIDNAGDGCLSGGQRGSIIFLSLKKLWIDYCPNFEGWWRKRDDTMTGQLPQFRCLSLLEIKHCPKLSCMPLFPALSERLYYVNAGVEPLLQTTKIKKTTASPLTKVKELWISDISDLEYIDWDEEKYFSEGGAKVFPFLKKLWIYNCPNLKGWWKRRDDAAISTAELPQFPCLSLLEIKHCPKLSWMPLFPFLDQRLYYVKSRIQPLVQTIMVSSFSNLEELWLSELSDLHDLDSTGDVYSTGRQRGSAVFLSLKKLWIDNCPNFEGWWRRDDDTVTRQLPQFHCLSLLEIKHCPMLSCMPLFPSLEERLYYVNAGTKPLQQTMKIKKTTASPLTKVKELWISDLSDIEYLDWDEDNYFSEGGAVVFPSLKKLWIYNCPNLKGWWKRREDHTAKSMIEPPWFPCLSLLEIKHCHKLSWLPLFPSLDDELRLESANIEPLQRTMQMKMTASASSSSLVQPLSTLKVLWLVGMEDLESLPNTWLQNLISLQELHIKGCSRLASLPHEMRQLYSLRKLQISRCPLLKERCMKIDGADWPNIAHIPTVETDW